MYIILEIQTAADGSVGTIVSKRDGRDEAWSEYYRVLSAAAVSAVPIHSAVLLDVTGTEIEHRSFSHAAGNAE